MANKKKRAQEKPKREMTRRHLAMWQREKRRQRIIFYGGIFIVVAIVLILVGGWYATEFRPLRQTVIRVNDTEFSMSYYIDALKVAGSGQSADYIQSLAGSMVREIEQDELIRQEALKLGISVSDDEVREKLKDSKIPINSASLDLVRRQLIQDRLYKEYFDSKVPKTAPQADILAMFLESENQATDIRIRLQNSENFTALAEKYSLDSYSKTNKGDIGWHPQEILAGLLGSSVPGDYAFGSEVGTLSQPRYDPDKTKPLGYWLIKILENPGQDDAQVQGLLLGSAQEAQDVRAKLEGGSDLATLAKELSQNDKSKQNGGDLGVVSKGEITAAFDGYVFGPAALTGTWSQPVSDNAVGTQGGYWLIKVVDKAGDRQLDANDRNSLMNKAFSDWVSSLWVAAAGKVDDSYLDGAKQVWAAQEAAKG